MWLPTLTRFGLEPAGDNGGWYQDFEFTSGVALADNNRLAWRDTEYEVDQQWRPLAFSATGQLEPAAVVFAGYGITAPEDPDAEGDAGAEYDSYVHLDVKDKWVLAFRYLPEDISAQRRQHLTRYSHPRFKAMTARDRGARGLILVSGPRSNVKDQLIPMRFDGALAGASLAVLSVTDQVAEAWLKSADRDLADLQAKLDSGQPVMGFALPEVTLQATIGIQRVKKQGRNVLARLPAADAAQTVIVGAHIDHLGRGGGGSSLAKEDEANQIHFGADDNASGVAAVLEVAQFLSVAQRSGQFNPRRDIVFAAWSGEELGLLGSSHYAKQLVELTATDDNESGTASLYPALAACVNLDMVGRLEKKLVLQGIGSSSIGDR